MAIAFVIVFAVAVIGASRWQLNEYAITPGQSTNVTPLVSVKGLATNAHPDQVNFVDVWLQQLSMLQYVRMQFEKNVTFVSGQQLEEPGVPTSELVAQGYQQMNDAKVAAEAAALRALGWTLTPTATGAVITGVTAESPASTAGLKVQDRIVAANGHAVTSSCGLVAVLHAMPAGTHLTLTIVKQGFTAIGVPTTGATVTVHLVTAGPPAGAQGDGCPGVNGVDRSFIGVGLEDGVRYNFPATFAINTASIGGPSAGLAMTVAILDLLSKGSLTGGHAIATTGTIDAYGNVGEVGGVAQKTIAVENAGVKYFFVPAGEAAVAQSEATPSFHVIGVTTLAQVLTYLHRMGGSLPVSITPPAKP